MADNSLAISANALNVYQDEINMVSNNLANSGTTAFKDQTLQLTDQPYQEIATPSAPTSANGGTDPVEEGLGVKVASRDTDFSQGGIQTNGVSTDMAINGNGFFILGSLNGTQSPTYTRDGAFTLNQNGVLIDPATGLAVQGYTASSTGVLPSAGSAPQNIIIPIGLTTTATATGSGAKSGPNGDNVFDMTQGGNLDASQWQTEEQGVVLGVPGKGAAQTLTTTIYDSLGNPHTLSLTYTPDATGAVAGNPNLPASMLTAGGTSEVPATRWKVTASFSDGTKLIGQGGVAAASDTLGYAYFDQAGQFINTSSQTNPPATFADVHQADTTASLAAGNMLNIVSWPQGNQSTANPVAATTGPIAVSFANMSSLSGQGQPITTVSQNGYGQGTLQTFTVGNTGVISGSFSNGETKVMGGIALANFENLEGLQSVGSGQYAETPASGLAQIGNPTDGQFGAIQDDALEQSNVSIATEFTKLIVAQSAYLSNSKAITISNQDLQAVDQLIA